MIEEIKSVSASLNIEVNVDCPHCDNSIDILDCDETDGHDHNEEGHVMNQACPQGYWMDEHKKFEVLNVTCGECKKDFHVKGLEW